MAKKNICLTTYFNKDYSQISHYCLNSLKKYGLKFGYPVILHNEVSSNNYPPWNKIFVIKKLFSEGYDYVFYIDADAMIVNFDYDIADQIEPEKEWYLAKQQKEFNEGYVPNTGIMLIKNTDFSKNIFDQLWQLDHYHHHYWADQAALVELIGLKHELPQKFQSYIKSDTSNQEFIKKIKWLNENWNENQKYITNNTIIIHAYGTRLCYKLWHLNRFSYKLGLINIIEFLKTALYSILLRLIKK